MVGFVLRLIGFIQPVYCISIVNKTNLRKIWKTIYTGFFIGLNIFEIIFYLFIENVEVVTQSYLSRRRGRIRGKIPRYPCM